MVQNDPFFWDTVQLASKHAHFFYENGLRWLALPESIDSGHPPVFGWYLAHIWTFFGKNLPASHWAMLPFLLLNVWMLYRLGLRFGGERWAFWLIPLVLLDPVVAGQSVLVSPDMVLVCGFLLAVEGISGKNKWMTSAGILLLCMISVRGMMTAGALAVWTLALDFRIAAFQGLSIRTFSFYVFRFFGFSVKKYLPFLPGFAFAAWFLWWHKEATGWSGLNPDSPWAPTFKPAEGLGLVRNLLVVCWRWLDFGRVFEWLVLGWLIWKNRHLKKADPVAFGLFLLLICLILFLSPSAILFTNVSAHRYFLPGFLVLHLFVFQILTNQKVHASNPSFLLKILTAALAFGNLWVYPRGVAMGWDATLAHLPYHDLREKAIVYLDTEKIDFQKVGSFFPNLNTGENLMLNGDYRYFSEKDFSRNEYIFISNVFNDISDADYFILKHHWFLIKEWQQAGVRIAIYQKRQ